MSLFYLVKQNDRIRLAADFLGELACLVVADIARRRADNARYAELFHKLGHIESYKRLGRVEKIGCKALYKLGFANACSADKDKACRLALCLEAYARALYCRAHGIYRLVLTDDMRFQALIKLGKALKLILADRRCRDLRPQLDYASKVIYRKLGNALKLKRCKLLLALHLLAAKLGYALVALIERFVSKLLTIGRVGAHERFALELKIVQILLKLGAANNVLILEVYIRARLVDKVYGLIRQEAVGNIALRHFDGLGAHLVGYLHSVVILVIAADTLEYLDAVGNGRLVYGDRLEPALERGILFDMLAVLGESSCADDLYLAS